MRSTEAAKQAGFATYGDYLRSRHWRSLKASYRANRLWVCVCGAKDDLELHHLSYDNLGDETLDELSPLCTPCHATVHEGGELDPNALERLIRASRYSESRPDHSEAKALADRERELERHVGLRRKPQPSAAERLAAREATHGTVPTA